MAVENRPVTVVDARGKSCPGPVIELRKGIRELKSGEIIELRATDKGSLTDIPAWAEETGNEVVATTQDGGMFSFLVRKGE